VRDVFKRWHRFIPPLFSLFRRGALFRDTTLADALQLLTKEEQEEAFHKCHVVSWDIKNREVRGGDKKGG
jgi:hypothetical protein